MSPLSHTPPCFLSLMFDDDGRRSQPDALFVLLPLLVILSTLLLLLLTFLICVVIVRRRRGIILRDSDGPVDMSREELIEGDGGFENIEARWLDEANENSIRAYLRAKGIPYRPSTLLRDPLNFSQNFKFSIPQTPYLQTSHCPSFFLFRRKVYRPGPLNRILKPSTPYSSTRGLKSLSFQTPLPLLASSLIFLFRS